MRTNSRCKRWRPRHTGKLSEKRPAYGQPHARRSHAWSCPLKPASLGAWHAIESLQESNANALEVAAGLRQALDAKLGSFETSFQVRTQCSLAGLGPIAPRQYCRRSPAVEPPRLRRPFHERRWRWSRTHCARRICRDSAATMAWRMYAAIFAASCMRRRSLQYWSSDGLVVGDRR